MAVIRSERTIYFRSLLCIFTFKYSTIYAIYWSNEGRRIKGIDVNTESAMPKKNYQYFSKTIQFHQRTKLNAMYIS